VVKFTKKTLKKYDGSLKQATVVNVHSVK